MVLAVVRCFETDLARLGAELQAVRDRKNSEADATQRNRRKESPPVASPPTAPAKSPPAAVPSVPAQPARLDSLIVRDYPPLFEEFRTKRWVLLWWGSRDGFTGQQFHRLCDGHANTLTLILGTDGNVFGGFTPVKWESGLFPKVKGDDSLQSFLFTLRNPHDVSPRKFALKKEKKEETIFCSSDLGPYFYNDICVKDNCNTNKESWTWIVTLCYTYIGTRYEHCSYENDSRFESFLTGAHNFTVKEIEVFEIK
jgi:hypothetical protein